jgi:hypothetical protein
VVERLRENALKYGAGGPVLVVCNEHSGRARIDAHFVVELPALPG